MKTTCSIAVWIEPSLTGSTTGSLSARFYGRVDGGRFDSLRVGYEYHDGLMIPKPDSANYFTEPGLRAYNFRLTNGWYEWSK
jgi:hypothetical protein